MGGRVLATYSEVAQINIEARPGSGREPADAAPHKIASATATSAGVHLPGTTGDTRYVSTAAWTSTARATRHTAHQTLASAVTSVEVVLPHSAAIPHCAGEVLLVRASWRRQGPIRIELGTMSTCQAAVARLEAGGVDSTRTTLQKENGHRSRPHRRSDRRRPTGHHAQPLP